MRWGDSKRVTNGFKWGHMSWPKPTTSQMSTEPANATKALFIVISTKCSTCRGEPKIWNPHYIQTD